MSDIVNKLWGFCHTLRHDGIDYGDYIEQLTYLLFLKMADERGVAIPKTYNWETLKKESGQALLDHYADILRNLREQPGLLGDIFTQAMARFNNPVNLKQLITMIDKENWSAMDVDVKGAAFEGLLERSASEGKKGAGQYFTPRELIKSIVRVSRSDPRTDKTYTICDPACGTGGFLVAAYEWLMDRTRGALPMSEIQRIRQNTYFGQEFVPRPRRLALMNLFLHGIEATIYYGDTIYEPDRGERYDCVFEILMQDCNVHTILRLPRGTFTPYSPGVKANVVFFQKGLPTENTWIFDARSNVPGITKKERPLTPDHFAEFEKCFGPDPDGRSDRTDLGPEGRFRKFHISDIKEREYKLDITWLRDESLEDANDLPEPEVLVSEAITELEAVVDDLRDILEVMNNAE